jgi:3-dehydroquinate synthase
MKKLTYKFSNSSVDYYLAYGISHLKEIVDKDNTIIITDENVYNAHTKKIQNWNCIVLKPGRV